MPVMIFCGVNLLQKDVMPKRTFDMWNFLLSIGFSTTYFAAFIIISYLSI